MSAKIYLSPAAHEHDNPCSFDRTDCGENIHCNIYADHLQEILIACGFDVKRNPKDRTGERLKEAIAEANQWGADFYYVCHTNGGGGAYSRLMVYDNGTGYTYAQKIAEREKVIYTNPIQITLNPELDEIRLTNAPCVYHEVVFHDNPDEITYFHHHFRDFALCTAKGICDIFGVDLADPPAAPVMRVGAQVQYSGRLYCNSYGIGFGKTVNGTFTVSRIIKNRKCGVLLNDRLGWVPESACKVIG